MMASDWINIGGFIGMLALGWRMYATLRRDLTAGLDGVRREVDSVRREVDSVRREVAGVSERLARIEGWIEGRFNPVASGD